MNCAQQLVPNQTAVTKSRSLTFHPRPSLPGLITLALALMLARLPAQAKVMIAADGIARCLIVTQPGATPAERYAAEELAATLRQITGATFVTRELADNVPASAIVVGAGPLTPLLFPEANLAAFGGEEYLMRTQGGRLLLAGGRPRGTLYAVYRFLQDQLGVRYYAPWFTHYPNRSRLTLGTLNVRGKPAFEYRDPFWFPAFDGDWAASATAPLAQPRRSRRNMAGRLPTRASSTPSIRSFRPRPISKPIPSGSRWSMASVLAKGRSFMHGSATAGFHRRAGENLAAGNPGCEHHLRFTK